MELIEFYLNKIKKFILLDDTQTVIVRQVLDDFYRELVDNATKEKIWMEGYLEGKGYEEGKDYEKRRGCAYCDQSD